MKITNEELAVYIETRGLYEALLNFYHGDIEDTKMAIRWCHAQRPWKT